MGPVAPQHVKFSQTRLNLCPCIDRRILPCATMEFCQVLLLPYFLNFEAMCLGILNIVTTLYIYHFSSVTQSCLPHCDPMDCSKPGLAVHHQLPELTQTHIHLVGYAIQPSHPLSSPSPPTFSLSQHQGLFQWVSSSDQVAKVLEFQLQDQSFQWTFRTDFL